MEVEGYPPARPSTRLPVRTAWPGGRRSPARHVFLAGAGTYSGRSPKQYAYSKRLVIILGLYAARPQPYDLCLPYILLKSICSTASIINHTKLPSDNHSLKSGGSKYPCSRLHSIKLYAICFPPESFVDNCSLII